MENWKIYLGERRTTDAAIPPRGVVIGVDADDHGRLERNVYTPQSPAQFTIYLQSDFLRYRS